MPLPALFKGLIPNLLAANLKKFDSFESGVPFLFCPGFGIS
jgi:hypothetical protein